MQLIRRNRTVAALNRRFERDRVFQFADTVSGPAVTPAGMDNSGLALRYGTFPAVMRPKERGWCGIAVLWGATAARWAKLSDIEGNFLVFGDRFAVKW
jgi:hypothetical protein